MPAARRDKTTGLPLPSPVVPATTLCFRMTIPNALEYRTALKGVLSDLGRAWTWTQTVGQDNNDAHEAAALWRAAIAQSEFFETCEADMSCSDVENCIEMNAGVQNAINNLSSAISTPGVIVTPGQPMTPTQVLGALNPTETCDWDVLWAQAKKLVEYATTAGTDLLEKIEQYSNAVEAGQYIEMIPVIGTLFDEAQLDQVLEFINWTQENVQEAYQSALDEPLKEAIACAIFCAAKPDCVISVQLLWDVMNERLGGLLNPSEITDFAELANAMVQTGLAPSLPVDLWLAFLFGGAKFAGYLGVRGIDQTLALALLLAADEPSNDWETLCLDCPENDWCYFQNTTETVEFMELSYTQDGYNYVTAWTDGVGILGASPGLLDENIPKVNLPLPRLLTQVSFDVNVTSDNAGAAAYLFIDGVLIDTEALVNGPQSIAFAIEPTMANFVQIGVDRVGADRRQIGPITAWQIVGKGDNPFGDDNCDP